MQTRPQSGQDPPQRVPHPPPPFSQGTLLRSSSGPSTTASAPSLDALLAAANLDDPSDLWRGRLDGDGVAVELFHYLYAVRHYVRSMTLPETILFEKGWPKVWYSSDPDILASSTTSTRGGDVGGGGGGMGGSAGFEIANASAVTLSNSSSPPPRGGITSPLSNRASSPSAPSPHSSPRRTTRDAAPPPTTQKLLGRDITEKRIMVGFAAAAAKRGGGFIGVSSRAGSSSSSPGSSTRRTPTIIAEYVACGDSSGNAVGGVGGDGGASTPRRAQASSAPTVQVQYFDREGLKAFLSKRASGETGVLQAFTVPKTSSANCSICAVWSPSAVQVTMRRSIVPFNAPNLALPHDLWKMGVTHDGPTDASAACNLTPHLRERVDRAVQELVAVIEATEGTRIRGMVLILKLDRFDHLKLIRCTSLRTYHAGVARHLASRTPLELPGSSGGGMPSSAANSNTTTSTTTITHTDFSSDINMKGPGLDALLDSLKHRHDVLRADGFSQRRRRSPVGDHTITDHHRSHQLQLSEETTTASLKSAVTAGSCDQGGSTTTTTGGGRPGGDDTTPPSMPRDDLSTMRWTFLDWIEESLYHAANFAHERTPSYIPSATLGIRGLPGCDDEGVPLLQSVAAARNQPLMATTQPAAAAGSSMVMPSWAAAGHPHGRRPSGATGGGYASSRERERQQEQHLLALQQRTTNYHAAAVARPRRVSGLALSLVSPTRRPSDFGEEQQSDNRLRSPSISGPAAALPTTPSGAQEWDIRYYRFAMPAALWPTMSLDPSRVRRMVTRLHLGVEYGYDRDTGRRVEVFHTLLPPGSPSAPSPRELWRLAMELWPPVHKGGGGGGAAMSNSSATSLRETSPPSNTTITLAPPPSQSHEFNATVSSSASKSNPSALAVRREGADDKMAARKETKPTDASALGTAAAEDDEDDDEHNDDGGGAAAGGRPTRTGKAGDATAGRAASSSASPNKRQRTSAGRGKGSWRNREHRVNTVTAGGLGDEAWRIHSAFPPPPRLPSPPHPPLTNGTFMNAATTTDDDDVDVSGVVPHGAASAAFRANVSVLRRPLLVNRSMPLYISLVTSSPPQRQDRLLRRSRSEQAGAATTTLPAGGGGLPQHIPGFEPAYPPPLEDRPGWCAPTQPQPHRDRQMAFWIQ